MNLVFRTIVIIAAMCAATVAHAKSQTFQFVAVCDGGDEVYKWSINGRTGAGGNTSVPTLASGGAAPFVNWPTPGAPGSSFVYPFTPNDILITGIELVLIPPGPGAATTAFTFLMPGNNYDGDAMVFLPSGQNHIFRDYPAGSEFHFPGYSSGSMTNMGYIDLHGSCTAGAVANVIYTFYYK